MKKVADSFLYSMLEYINYELFDNKLDLSDITIRQKRLHTLHMADYFDNEITIYLNWFDSLEDIKHTLAHELVHYYQDTLDLPFNHNTRFFQYYREKYLAITKYDFNAQVY
jgi:Zn-dependent peptidase ImmA (M78 family)